MTRIISLKGKSLFLSIAIAASLIGLFYPISSLPQERSAASYLPRTPELIHRKGYVLFYDGKTKNASWVYERLLNKNLQGEADRRKFDFKEDPLIPELLRAAKSDYSGSGFDRGHLCPAADLKLEGALEESFYLTNISPQYPQFNRGYWAQLEKHVRNLTKEFHILHVYTGPLYLPQEEPDGKRYVKYRVIGKNDVAVPTHFFKVIFAESQNGSRKTFAYILPNAPIPAAQPLYEFASTIEKIQKAAGIIFP